MNRLAYNLSFWPTYFIAFATLKAGKNTADDCLRYGSHCSDSQMLYIIGLIMCIIAFIIAGFRIKSLGRSLLNIIWMFIPIVAFCYALWLGITTDKR